MDYFYVDIETELGEMLTYYVAAMDEAQAEDFATAAFGFGSVTGLSSRILALPLDASLIRSTEISK